MSNIGFTGTRRGWTGYQRDALYRVFRQLRRAGFQTMHSGDCKGSDYLAANHWRFLGGVVYGHPPDVDAKRAFFRFDEEAPPRPYLERNKDIVDCSKVLVATPGEMKEEQRSGTWATIRAARRARVPITIIWPDGDVTREHFA